MIFKINLIDGCDFVFPSEGDSVNCIHSTFDENETINIYSQLNQLMGIAPALNKVNKRILRLINTNTPFYSKVVLVNQHYKLILVNIITQEVYTTD
jgi:hypothetical protein